MEHLQHVLETAPSELRRRMPARRMIAWIALATCCCAEPSFAAGAGQGASTGLSVLPGLEGLAGSLSQVATVQLMLGFCLGLAAGEVGRIGWKAGLGAWRLLMGIATLTARYGVVAGLLGAVLYFI